MQESLLTSEQVAHILQVHPLTVLKYIKAGKLKGIKLGRVWRIREADVNQFLEDRSMALKTTSKKDDITEVQNEIQVEETLSTQNNATEETHDHYIL